ncbi:MAG: cytidylate kinase family protein, partial [Bacteroidota bacterium]|nr:cytidylate kinase family protein [Bacteroidota bacterium]
MIKKESVARYLFFILGLLVNAFGISLIIKANLGSSPISSLPYTLSLKYPITLGQFTFLLNILLIAGQMVFLKKDFQKKQFLQIPISVLFSLFIDFSMHVLYFVVPANYISQIATLIAGCAILGFGVSMEVTANVVMLSGEAFVQAISLRSGKEFGIVKIFFDTTLALLACIVSLILLDGIKGVREGTVIAALIVGAFARFFNRRLKFIDETFSSFSPQEVIPEATSISATSSVIITIAREYGSGGRKIGQQIARDLNIPFYDSELITLEAKESGFAVDYVAEHEQSISNSLLFELIMQDYSAPIEKSLCYADRLFVAQSRVICNIAAQGPCVIVGRCADYILKNFPNCFNVFVHSDIDSEIKRTVNEYGVDAKQAPSEIKKINTNRANHYKHYTGR